MGERACLVPANGCENAQRGRQEEPRRPGKEISHSNYAVFPFRRKASVGVSGDSSPPSRSPHHGRANPATLRFTLRGSACPRGGFCGAAAAPLLASNDAGLPRAWWLRGWPRSSLPRREGLAESDSHHPCHLAFFSGGFRCSHCLARSRLEASCRSGPMSCGQGLTCSYRSKGNSFQEG